jgi:uracil-DNA glycosylase
VTTPDPAALALLLGQTRSLLASHLELGITAYPAAPELRHFAAARWASFQLEKEKKPASLRLETAVKEPFAAAPEQTVRSLAELAGELAACRRCGPNAAPCFGSGRTGAKLAVIGGCRLNTNLDSRIIWGQREDEMLWRMMAAIGLSREEVYVTDAVKCGQQNELRPGSEAERCCLAWLEQELLAVQPKVICAMGDIAANALLNRTKPAPMARLRGKFYRCPWSGITAPVVPTYHPGYLLLQPELVQIEMKKMTWLDLQAIQRKLRDV